MRIQDYADGIVEAGDGRMGAAEAKWSRLTRADFTDIRNKQDLIMRVEESYGLSHAFAVQDVELWDAPVRKAVPAHANTGVRS